VEQLEDGRRVCQKAGHLSHGISKRMIPIELVQNIGIYRAISLKNNHMNKIVDNRFRLKLNW
jgi:hypothetical protein